MATTPLLSIPLPVSSGTDQVPADLATALDFVEKQLVMVFATSSARTSAFTAAGVTPTAGMLCWLTSPGQFQTYTGVTLGWQPTSAWLPGQVDTSSLVGTYVAGTPLRMLGGAVGSVATNSSAIANVSFGEAVNGIKNCGGMGSGSTFAVTLNPVTGYTAGSFDAKVWNAGVAVPSSAVSVNWWALVW